MADQEGKAGNFHGGWDFVPTAGGTPDGGGSVRDIREVLGVDSYAIKNQPVQSDRGLDLDETTSGTPHEHKDGGPAPVPEG